MTLAAKNVEARRVEERESRVRRLRAAAVPYLLLLPAVLALAAVSLYPTLDGIRASLDRFRYGARHGLRGLGQFCRRLQRCGLLAGDPDHGDVSSSCVVAIETLLGLLLALLVARELRYAGLIRVMLILPMTIAPVVVGVIWRLLYASDIGVVDPLFQALGLDAPHVLAQPVTAFLGLVVVDVWEWTPLLFLIILAGLQSMPQDPIEAARVDGASRWQAFFHHTLPLLRPVLLVAVVLRTIDAVGTFDQVFVLTKGGPGTATQLISIYAYNTAFLFNQYGRAMAMLIGVLAFLIVLMTAAVRLMRQHLGEDRVTPRERLGQAFVYLALAVAILLALFPFWWMLATSLKRPVDIFSGVALWPQQITFDNYDRLFNNYHFGYFLLNSVVVVTAAVTVSLILGTLAAYALARFRLQFGVRKMALYLVLLVGCSRASCSASRSISCWRTGAC